LKVDSKSPAALLPGIFVFRKREKGEGRKKTDVSRSFFLPSPFSLFLKKSPAKPGFFPISYLFFLLFQAVKQLIRER
jgi:hypothetical protein